MRTSRRRFLAAAAGSVASLASVRWMRGEERPVPKESLNPFLSDNFAPVHEEVVAEKLPVIGQIPADLRGMFVRNGPNPQFPPKLHYHWFDGDGMLHGVQLLDGQASYRNRWVRTTAWDEEHAAGKSLFPSLLDPPDLTQFAQRALSGKSPFANRSNTALVWHHGKLLALWEGGEPYEIELPNLETIGPYTFDGRLKHAFTAHPKVDPITGELMFFGYSPTPPYLQYSVADRKGTIVRTTPIELPQAVMMHDAAITENHTVFLDLPATFDLPGMFRGEPSLKWMPERGARIGILPRHAQGSEIRWFEVEVGFVFHVFNAWELGSQVTLEACRFADYPAFVGMSPGDVTRSNFDDLLRQSPAVAYRWTFDLETGGVTETALDNANVEFPRIDERRTGRPARFGYAISGAFDSSALVKYDLQTGTSHRHGFPAGSVAGEAVFVPRTDATGEDDGYLLTFVYDNAEERSELVILNARDVTASPVARVRMPQRVPYGFHGLWVADNR